MSPLVELLFILDAPAEAPTFILDAMHVDRAFRATALATVDTCTLATPRKAVVIRVSRADFDAAVDQVLPLLQAFRDRWGDRARVVMEEKRPEEVAGNPITRWLIPSPNKPTPPPNSAENRSPERG